jgi:hypothetical protein
VSICPALAVSFQSIRERDNLHIEEPIAVNIDDAAQPC